MSEEVRIIQNRLNRISANFPNIPKIYPVDGIFDADTERAVRAFQQQFNLTADGIVGRATWYRIAFIYNNVKRLSELDSEGLLLEDVSPPVPGRAARGRVPGPGVQLLQYFLAIVGEYYDQLPRWQPAQIDGIFGPQTREAVAAYQRLLGLPETGVVDPHHLERAGLHLSVRACGTAHTGVAGRGGRLPGYFPGRGHARRGRAPRPSS